MEINVKTERYTAGELQKLINENWFLRREYISNNEIVGCIILPGENPGEYVAIVENDIQAKLVKTMLQQLGVEVCQ